ncbi:Uncharacterized protein Rs2_27314 [Raphanus sativus]|nr:Uncharacterized protein Rs2_27314 [Raphanus sativus]
MVKLLLKRYLVRHPRLAIFALLVAWHMPIISITKGTNLLHEAGSASFLDVNLETGEISVDASDSESVESATKESVESPAATNTDTPVPTVPSTRLCDYVVKTVTIECPFSLIIFTLSTAVSSFLAVITAHDIPNSFKEAMLDSKWLFTLWRGAMSFEVHALERQHKWDLQELPPKKKRALDNKWVFTINYRSDGTIERFMASSVAEILPTVACAVVMVSVGGDVWFMGTAPHIMLVCVVASFTIRAGTEK